MQTHQQEFRITRMCAVLHVSRSGFNAWQRRRPAPGLVHHSAQGNQYRATLYQTNLVRRGVVLSLSRKGNGYDTTPVESFFSSLQNERVWHRQFQTQAAAQTAIEDYIDRFYNRQRLHQALGYRSPEEFERQKCGA